MDFCSFLWKNNYLFTCQTTKFTSISSFQWWILILRLIVWSIDFHFPHFLWRTRWWFNCRSVSWTFLHEFLPLSFRQISISVVFFAVGAWESLKFFSIAFFLHWNIGIFPGIFITCFLLVVIKRIILVNKARFFQWLLNSSLEVFVLVLVVVNFFF